MNVSPYPHSRSSLSPGHEVRRERPLSPHLQVYKPQLTSVLSIFHRITGVALTLGAMFFVCWLYHLSEGEVRYMTLHSVMISSVGRVFLIGWSFALFFHLFNGIRHLLWDMGLGFELKEVYATGYAVVFLSLLLTGLFWGVLLCL